MKRPAVASDAPRFNISPEVVFRLGDELITDEMQALVELVKNSYDASATSARVTVESEDPVEIAGVTKKEEPVGWVEIRDDGDGMTREQLENGWLLISTSVKREMKEKGETNRLKRTPLGDKGLGRLGVLRLGVQVEIRTRPRSAREEHILRFTRQDFEREDALSEVKVHYEQRAIKEQKAASGGWTLDTSFTNDVSCGEVTGRQGTVIRVSGLTNSQVWEDRVRVQQEMLTLISPFELIRDFNLEIYLNDPARKDPLQLGELSELRRDLADLRWTFSFDREKLTVGGRFKLDAFAPSSANKELYAFWESNVVPDRGAELRRRLSSGGLKAYLAKAADDPWWLQLAFSIDRHDVVFEDPKLRTDNDRSWADPGPFSGELDSFSLSSDVDFGVEKGIFDSRQLYKRWVHDVRGIKVFRDGFGVRVGDDFLGLGKGFTGGRSFYALRPGNVVGYVALSAGDNAQLKETTDREGFIADPPYRSFAALLKALVNRVTIVQTLIGRELSKWAGEVEKTAEQSPAEKAGELAREAAAREQRTSDLAEAVESVRRTLGELGDGSALLTPDQVEKAAEAGRLLEQLQGLAAEGEKLTADLSKLANASAEVERERSDLRGQLQAAYQTVGLGIVAETVAHEMANVTGRLEARVDALAPQFKGPEQRAARALASEIKTTVRAIRRQIRHLEPQLRYQRTSRQTLDVSEVVEEVADYHRERLADLGIAVVTKGKGFQASCNRGRLQQALDNLIINSEFWLRHAETPKPRIELSIKRPKILVRDNGPGVDPGLETAIFEPFVSGRTGEEGRGLGLFITRQVLRDDEATIYLGDRDKDGRRRAFVLDLSGALPDRADA
ncbi:MAG TPA: sensor histidine kinase [Solirubrobacterales bacterium]|nr:sensor histidine kinase [Solirubrobacterales bacterium]